MFATALPLIVPAFFAGMLMFLAPCTLPLVPAYLSFISGVSLAELKTPASTKEAKRRIFLNGVFYVLGFSAVFILLGTLFGLGGAALIHYRVLLSQIGGVFIIFFGLFLLGVIKLEALMAEHRFHPAEYLKPGNPFSSFVFGATFAFGWTPCAGPILGTILTLAASSATVASGAFLLAIFSLGLALPFLIIALSISSATAFLSKNAPRLHVLTKIGGVLLVLLGILLVFNSFELWVGRLYALFNFLDYDALLKYL